LRDALLLNLRRVLKTTVHHSAKQLGLQQKILEGGSMNANVVPPLIQVGNIRNREDVATSRAALSYVLLDVLCVRRSFGLEEVVV
jgi:hypothetical protein